MGVEVISWHVYYNLCRINSFEYVCSVLLINVRYHMCLPSKVYHSFSVSGTETNQHFSFHWFIYIWAAYLGPSRISLQEYNFPTTTFLYLFCLCNELFVTRLRLLKGTKEEESPRLNVYLTAKSGFGLNPFATDSSPMPPRIKSVAHRFPRTQQTHFLMRTTSIRTATMWYPETTTPATRSKSRREQSCQASLACALHTW